MSKTIDGLFYITHIDNLASILEHGILSHNEIERQGLDYEAIYDGQIVSRRRFTRTPANRSLWEYANLYFQPRNPMLFRVTKEISNRDIVVIKVRKKVLSGEDVLITDGNAAHSQSQFYPYSTDVIKGIQKSLGLEYWNDTDGTKRRIMAECLVPNRVSPDLFECLYVGTNNGTAARARDIVAQVGLKLNVIAEPRMFFLPKDRIRITPNVSLVEGDMFFSNNQTLTISVNTVGVMGKGLASRAKYQFPDVYVAYQDLCKDNVLQVGKPALFKRETSIAAELAESGEKFESESGTWFLLFPTKKHWKEDSKLEYIVDGLAYLKENFKAWGINSLAMPALGCGLGNLDWAEVGPIMSTTLNTFGIPVAIYLPTERKIPQDQLTAKFLIRD